MVTARLYDAAGTREDAVAELRRCAGTQFDPELVVPFVRGRAAARLPRALVGPAA